MSFQPDLFAPALPPRLAFQTDLITTEEEEALIAEIAQLPLQPFQFQGWQGKRLTASFGYRYDFENGSFALTDPMPKFLLPLRAKVARFGDQPEDAWAQALVTRYDPGAGIGWHRDRPVFDRVVGVSLGAAAVLRLRQREDGHIHRASLPLPPRSVYLLSGDVRRMWEHSIVPIAATRWSITFRTLAAPA
jgi:DNA oxidative demethylase